MTRISIRIVSLLQHYFQTKDVAFDREFLTILAAPKTAIERDKLSGFFWAPVEQTLMELWFQFMNFVPHFLW